LGRIESQPPAGGNLLLAALPQRDLDILSAHLEPVTLESSRTLYDPDVPIEHVYFLDAGLVSLLGVLTDGTGVETAIIGREGMVGMPIFHRTDRIAEQAVVQQPGRGRRMNASALRSCLEQSEALGTLLHHYSACVFQFAAQSVACMSKHHISSRLARWLLHASDHSGTNQLELTQLFLSHMLGVRRSSVTVAASDLRDAKLITYTRRMITITDRAGLEQRSCECYGIVRSTYDRLVFGGTSPNPLTGVESSRDGMSTVGSPHAEQGKHDDAD
jgi:CRP-like cAMP-binding protein